MIKVEHLTKFYGEFRAVDDLSFEMNDSGVYGFLGPNGAGKSTTMNIITGCLSPSDGKVSIGGHDILDEPTAAKRLIGYLPEQPPLYMNETPLEYLSFVAECKGLKGAELKAQVNEVIEKVGLAEMKNRLISALSKGYKQRVGIAQALLGNPAVIILDEPTVGLDPIQIIEIRGLIKSLGENHTVILSSHILSEVQAICEKVLIISGGRLMAYDTPEALEKLMTASGGVEFSADTDRETAEAVLAGVPSLTDCEVRQDGETVRIRAAAAEGEAREIMRTVSAAFASKGIAVFDMSVKKANLEDVFIGLTDDTAAPAQEVTDESNIEA